MNIEISSDELKKCKLFVATPCYGGNCNASYAKSMIELGILCQQYGINLFVYYLSNESLVQRARNYCADEFMRSDCTHLMFIDSDIGFNAKNVIDLLGLCLYNKTDYNIIGAPYPKKTIAWDKIKLAVDKGYADKDPNVLEKFVGDYVINIGKEKVQFKADEPLEVMEIGTGFMMIPRDTLVKYQEAYPEYSYKPDHVRSENFDGKREITAFFDCTIDRNYKFKDIKNIVNRLATGEEVSASEAQDLLNKEATASKRYLSEDYNFCQYSRDIGLRVWLAPWMQLNHTGMMIFGGSLLDVLSIGASPTA